MADYYYTDANRQPAGPVPIDELRSMFREGKLANGALVAEVGASEWKPAAELLGGSSTGAPIYSAPPVAPTGVIGSSHGAQDAFFPSAGWSFGLGLASWVCSLSILTGIPAVICGHMALSRMKAENNNNSTAKVLAIIGLVLGYLSLAGMVFFILIFGLAMLGAMANP